MKFNVEKQIIGLVSRNKLFPEWEDGIGAPHFPNSVKFAEDQQDASIKVKFFTEEYTI